MITPEPMSKISIVCPKTYMERVIQKLYQLGMYHIEPHQKTDDLDIGKPLERSEKLAEILVKIRALLSLLDIEKSIRMQYTGKGEKDQYELGRKCRQIYDDTLALTDSIKTAGTQITLLTEKIRILDLLRKLQISKELLQDSKHLGRLIGELDGTTDIAPVKAAIHAVTAKHELITSKTEHKHLLALYAEKEKIAALRDALAPFGFIDIDLAPAFESRKKITEQLSELHAHLSKATTQRNAAQLNLNKIKREQVGFLVENERMLTEETKKAEVPLNFGETKKSFTIRGWIPTEQLVQVVDELKKTTNNSIHIIDEPLEEHDNIPIKFRHNILVKPYEFFLRLYELPNYREIDPSIMMFITFPLFFGFMLGDVGYGIVTLLLFLALRAKMPSARALLNIMIFSAIITIGFGFMFGEYFGFEHVSVETGEKLCSIGLCLPTHAVKMAHGVENVADFPRLISRVQGHVQIGKFKVLSVLVIGAIVGLIHLNLALLIGFFNILFEHGFMHAFLEKISWMVMEAGVAVLALSYGGTIALSPFAGFALLGMGIVMIYLGEGAKGLVEIPAIFSNILSYMRLGAVGLASVGLAVVVNENLAIPFFEKGGIFTVLAILILIIGHVINIALGVLGPFLHALRLHYVEFFSKFYQGGGVSYLPFGAREEEA
ncbi:MAG: V-type ATP synthase subunit I [Candidatus Woesearchaeota archaeon]|nr:V-type ATP synthase subunit I [Candidatus Woesearchaeota archaeon]